MFSILLSILSLSLLIILHEAGHFFSARRLGVKVEEFNFGYPPRLFSFKRNGIVYSFNAVPFGGYVVIFDEEGKNKSTPGSFSSQSFLKRAIILLGGPVLNIIIAFFIFTGLFWKGMPVYLLPPSYSKDIVSPVIISEINPQSPADLAGLKKGDKILSLKYLENTYSINSIEELQEKINEFKGKEIKLVIDRQKVEKEFIITPRVNPPAGEGSLGLALEVKADLKYPLSKAVFKAIEFLGVISRETMKGLISSFGKLFTKGDIKEFVGPVGIVVIATKGFDIGISYGFYILGIISFGLAVFNFLPIPAVDGGRILFLLIEKLKKRL